MIQTWLYRIAALPATTYTDIVASALGCLIVWTYVALLVKWGRGEVERIMDVIDRWLGTK